MDQFAERLLQLIGEGRRRNAFARQVGISETSLRQYLAGGMPGMDKVVQIARAANVSVEWLATGEGPRDKEAALSQSVSGTQPEHGSASMLPITDAAELSENGFVVIPRYEVQASAGHGLVPHGEAVRDFVAFETAYLRAAGIDARNAHLIQVKGRSMLPTFVDGEWVLVDTSIRAIEDDAIYAVVYGDTVLLKRVQLDYDGSVTLSSDNRAEGYGEQHIKGDDLSSLRIVGRVKRHIRSL